MLKQIQEETAVQNAREVMETLDELKKQGKLVEIQVCLKCKSPRIRRTRSTCGDIWGNMGLQQPSCESPD